MITSSISSPVLRSFLAGTCLLALGSSTTRATPADPPAAPGGSVVSEATPVTVPVGIDFLPYVGTSSALPHARRVVSLNLVGGLGGGLDAFELGGAFNLQSGDVSGLQIAGALNLVDGSVRGAQIAGALNLADDDLVGLQLAAMSFALGDTHGAQVSAINGTGQALEGAQVGAINVAGGGVEGAQVGAINVAGGGVEGAQVGAINVAGGEVDGLQLGAVNIAKKAKAGIGVINVYWDGWAESDVAITETTLTLAGVRHGSDALYNVYYAGTRLDRPNDVALGIGIGGRWLLTSQLELSFDVTSISTAIDGRFSGLHQQTSLRPQIAWRIANTLALWAGPTLNVLATDHDVEKLDLPASAVRLSDARDDVRVYVWPGFAAGVRLF